MSVESYSYGGWIAADRPAGTGGQFGIIRLVGWVTAASVALASIGTGENLSPERLLRQGGRQVQWDATTIGVTEVEHARTPIENLSRIRQVLKPAVSDLASTFGVSRQSVYNWLNGEPVAEENAAKLQDLAQAADILAHSGLPVDVALLRRKIASGRTLMQIAQAGRSASDAALLLVQIHRREAEQRERISGRFASRTRTFATADFDLPVSN